MQINSKGQVTIPAQLRHRYGFAEGDQVEVVADGNALRIVRTGPSGSLGDRVVDHLRGRAGKGMSTDELMALLRVELIAP